MSEFAAIIGSGLHLKPYGTGWAMESLKPSGPVLVGNPHGMPAI